MAVPRNLKARKVVFSYLLQQATSDGEKYAVSREPEARNTAREHSGPASYAGFLLLLKLFKHLHILLG